MMVSAGAGAAERSQNWSVTVGGAHHYETSETGLLFGFSLGMFRLPPIAFSADSGWVHSKQSVRHKVLEPDLVTETEIDDTITHDFIPVRVDARLSLGDPEDSITPYLIAGAGVAGAYSSHDNPIGAETQDFFGATFRLGAGARFGRLVIEADWQTGSFGDSGALRVGAPLSETFPGSMSTLRVGLIF